MRIEPRDALGICIDTDAAIRRALIALPRRTDSGVTRGTESDSTERSPGDARVELVDDVVVPDNVGTKDVVEVVLDEVVEDSCEAGGDVGAGVGVGVGAGVDGGSVVGASVTGGSVTGGDVGKVVGASVTGGSVAGGDVGAVVGASVTGGSVGALVGASVVVVVGVTSIPATSAARGYAFVWSG